GKSTIPNRAAMYAFIIIGISAGLGSIHFLGIFEFDSIYRFFVSLPGGGVAGLGGAPRQVGGGSGIRCLSAWRWFETKESPA
ncbi:hypothetical protein P3G55_23810, partial [Leptospira sp. 96542]|nr:hypothetical protein [Leptospira sp. 96542]